jgi:hypothetical protein
MKFSFLPKTKLGLCSVFLIIIVVLLVVLFFLLINVFEQRGGDTFFSNLALAIPMVLAFVAGVLALIIGLIATIKSKSQSILVYIAMLIGLLIALYGISEVAFPH